MRTHGDPMRGVTLKAEPNRDGPPTARRWVGMVLALAITASALAQALMFPAAALPLTALLVAALAAVIHRPAWALVILPAAMPVLDLAPLSGRLLWDEFDLLQLAVLPVVWLRTRCPAGAMRSQTPVLLKLSVALLAASLAVSMLRGGWPWPWPDANSLVSQHDPYNALRIGKGALWALALILLMRRLPEDEDACQRLLGGGLCLGLALTVGVVLWERAAFVGLVDFEADYRVTGPFSAMNTGGATIECFLAVGAAIAMAAFLQWRQPWARAGMALLLVLTSYAVMVTYSRNGYAALLAVVLVMALAVLRQKAPSTRRWLAAAAMVLAMLAAAVPVLLGGFAQQRLAQSAQDYAVRLAHWRDALALRDGDLLTAVFGAGLGRFPAFHLWRSTEPVHAGVFKVDHDESGPLLRLGAGAAVYVEQVVDVGPGQRLLLSLDQRSLGGARLGVALCEKWLLTSAQCARVESTGSSAAGERRRDQWRLDTTGWAPAPLGLARPVKLALFRGAGEGAIEVAKVQLATEDGRQLLVNGDFQQGLDHWFYSTDVDPPWHIHSLPVTVLFDQGWLGVLAWSSLLVLALRGAARRAWRGDLVAVGVLAALVAFCVSGLVNSLIDTPRMLWLWCLLLWLGAATRRADGARRP